LAAEEEAAIQDKETIAVKAKAIRTFRIRRTQHPPGVR
jgi:hypothetical protein